MLHFGRSASLVTILAVLASCSQTLTGPVSTTSPSPNEYIWSSSSLQAGVDFNLVRNGITSDHLLSSSDGIHVRDAALNANAFMLHSFSDSVMIDSIGMNSIFSLPAGYSFVGKTQTTQRYFGVNRMITLSSGRVIVATDDGIYYLNGSTNWVRTFNGAVRALVQDKNDNVYAAIGDAVISSSDGGGAWSTLARPHPGTVITALAWASSGTLFVGFEHTYGVERSQSLTFKSYISANIPATSVTAIAAQGDTAGDEEVVVADSAGILSYVKGISNLIGPPNARCVFLDSLGVAYAGADGFGLLVRQSLLGNWFTVTGTQGDTIVGMIGHGADGIFAVTRAGALLSLTKGSFDVLTTTHYGTRSLCFDRKNSVLVGSDAGIVGVSGSPSQVTATFGPDTMIQFQTPGGLTILQREGMTAAGSIAEHNQTAWWPGGTLVGPGLDSGVSIMAHVMDHVNSLHVQSSLDSTKSDEYGESYVIRYSHETPDGSLAPNFPLYWLVYYSQGVGPVVIEEYTIGANLKYSQSERATLRH